MGITGFVRKYAALLGKSRPRTIIFSRRKDGFFSIFNGVVQTACELGLDSPQAVYVDYKSPLYTDNDCENIWDFIFDQGDQPTVEPVRENPGTIEDRRALAETYKACFAQRLRPEVADILDQFVEQNFGRRTLGVHIRSTDRAHDRLFRDSFSNFTEELVVAEIQELLEQNPDFDRIFVTSDFRGYKDAVARSFGSMVTMYDSLTSDDIAVPIHGETDAVAGSGRRKAFDIFIEATLLSRCDFLLRTMSNVTIATLYMNPDLPFLDLSIKHKNPAEAERYEGWLAY